MVIKCYCCVQDSDDSWEEGDSDYDIQSLDEGEHGNESENNDSQDEDTNENELLENASLDENWSADEDEVDKTTPFNDESSGSGSGEGGMASDRGVASSLLTWDEADYTDTSDEEVSMKLRSLFSFPYILPSRFLQS